MKDNYSHLTMILLLLMPRTVNAQIDVFFEWMSDLLCWIPLLNFLICNVCAFHHNSCLHGTCIGRITSYSCNCDTNWGGIQCSVPFETKLDSVGADYFGPVAIEEDTIAIRSLYTSSVFIFHRLPGLTWTQQAILV